MAYVTVDQQHLPVGSGPVESAVRRVINLRFKAPGSFWEAQTVAELTHLRAARSRATVCLNDPVPAVRPPMRGLTC